MFIIAIIAYVFWAILGFIFWIPLLVRVIAAFCGSLAYNMIIQNPSNILNSKNSLDLAISFYAKGFKSIHSALFESNTTRPNIKNTEFHFVPFILQVVWTIIFWASIIIPFTGFDYSFRREYVFKENFENGDKWDIWENNRAKVKVQEGKLFVQCKEDPNDNSYGVVVTKCTFPMYNCPSKYKVEINCELIAGNENRPFGLVFADREGGNSIRFSATGTKSGLVSIRINNEHRETCKEVTINSNRKDYKIKIEVRADTYTYYLNDEEICTDKFGGFSPYYLGTFASRTQSVEFDDVIITKK